LKLSSITAPVSRVGSENLQVSIISGIPSSRIFASSRFFASSRIFASFLESHQFHTDTTSVDLSSR